ncbi:hypothetical protein [Priestia flexa]|uniref:hypothetical protein n=1 Tax=Priestia flexa TaxID=86664 RepID=UPI000D73F2AA|nr:hypothetical protein [Priestia flexa]MCA1203282.1 hypothetical protein [Priestia flexa]
MFFEVLKFASNEQLYAKQKLISSESVSLHVKIVDYLGFYLYMIVTRKHLSNWKVLFCFLKKYKKEESFYEEHVYEINDRSYIIDGRIMWSRGSEPKMRILYAKTIST